MRNAKRRAEDAKGEFSCMHCGARFLTLQALGGHKSVHRGKTRASWTLAPNHRLNASALFSPPSPQSFSDCAATPSKRARVSPDRLSDPLLHTPPMPSWSLDPFDSCHTATYPSPLKALPDRAPSFAFYALAPPPPFNPSSSAALAHDGVNSCQVSKAPLGYLPQLPADSWLYSRSLGGGQDNSTVPVQRNNFTSGCFQKARAGRQQVTSLPALPGASFLSTPASGISFVELHATAGCFERVKAPPMNLRGFGLFALPAALEKASSPERKLFLEKRPDVQGSTGERRRAQGSCGRSDADPDSKADTLGLSNKPEFQLDRFSEEARIPFRQTSCAAVLPPANEKLDLTLKLSLF